MAQLSTSPTTLPTPIGLATLLRLAYEGADLMPLRHDMLQRAQSAGDPAALMDLWAIDQFLGDPNSGLGHQREALRRQQVYQSGWAATADALRVLVFMAPGDLSTNTPIEFLLKDSNIVLHSFYVLPGQPLPATLPPHDVAIVAVGESDQDRPVMDTIARWIADWPVPVLNDPSRIVKLSREETWRLLRDTPGAVMPATVRVTRETLEVIGRGFVAVETLVEEGRFPMIVRPVGSHAGRGLARLDDRNAIAGYLDGQPEGEFFISPYIDYRSADGQFRKYRIVWIDGRPFPVHMAIAEDWKVWYLNADMEESVAKRAEEAAFMSGFDADFAARHKVGLAAVSQRFGLEYCGVDCAETPDGRLLIFEADVAMIVHDLDSPDTFPYKIPAMRKLFAAYQDMLRRKAMRTGAVLPS